MVTSEQATGNRDHEYVGFAANQVDVRFGFRCVHGSTVVEKN